MMKAEILIKTNELSHDEWLKQRTSGIGGSDCSAILGMNPYMSPFDVYANKLNLIPDKPDNEAMRQGRDLEAYVAERFCEATGKKVRRRNAILHHPEYPWMLGNVDRLVIGEQAGMEAKTTSILNRSQFRAGEYPDNYYVQCMHYLAVTGLQKWYLAVLVLNKGFHIFEIDRDEEEIKSLIEAEKYFWEYHVQKQIPPPPDGSKAAGECLKALYPEAAEGEIRNLYGNEGKLGSYMEFNRQIKIMETDRDKIEQELKLEMKDAEEGKASGYLVRWKNRSRSNFDGARLQKEQPDLYKTYLKVPTTYRVFEVKTEGDKNNG